MLGRIVRRVARERRPVRFLASRVLWHAGLSRLFSVRRDAGLPGGYRLRFYPSALSSHVWTYPDYVNQEEAYIARTLGAGETFVDVGANVGLLALRAASVVGPTGTVIAIEGHPRTAWYLGRNAALNGFAHLRVESCAVGAERGTARFSDRHSDEQNGVVPEHGFTVPVLTLDELVPEARAPRIDLLKIDVEGYELPVLRGAASVLARADRVLFESSERHSGRYGYPPAAVYEVLRSAGFGIARLADGRPVGPDYRPEGTENLVATRELS